MFQDMLTANAAAQHGHEYSPPRPSASPLLAKSAFFNTSPFSIFNSVMRGASPVASSTTSLDTPTEQADPAPRLEKPSKSGQQEATPSSPAMSRSVSSGSDVTVSTEARPKKRAPRPKTIYHLAQPPPITTSRQKLHLRPKILLQLQQVVPSRRPKPVYEVIPSALLAPRSVRRFARTVANKDKLGLNDLLVVKAEEYDRKVEKKSDEERWGTRDVIGMVCVGDKSEKKCTKTEILMDDASCWGVTHMANGGYEFEYVDTHGLPLRCRWVPKPPQSRRVSSMSSNSQQAPNLGPEEKKFTFSTISPTSRRHPIIATMTRSSIEVLDFYTMPAATSSSTPTSPAVSPPPMSPLGAYESGSFFPDLDRHNDQAPIRTEEALRAFIVVTGIWVASCESWYDAHYTKHACPTPLRTSYGSSRPSMPNRAMSMTYLDSPRSASPASLTEEPRHTLPKLLRSSSQILHLNSSHASSTITSSVSAKTSPVSSPVRTRGRRSNSTGNADFNPRMGSTRRKFGLGLDTQALTETEEERQSKHSLELLRIKELGITTTAPVSPITPLQIIEPPTEDSRSPSPTIQEQRQRKTQSAYNPITTAGMWDSGVPEGNGAKKRPQSMVVLGEKVGKTKKSKKGKFRRFFKIFRKEKEHGEKGKSIA